MAKKSTEQYERAVKNLLETSYAAGNLHVKGTLRVELVMKL